ncbi:MAG: HRDC domain-containing protein [Proteobacteria bacterium]|nr:HRDC domain-containing protein [Pseudomonadota bacterium]MCZ6784442.1 HRDC domain-containing protein [Pseudomonadota bacterium]
MADFEIIERLSDLEALSKDLLTEKIIAVDTEADSFYHYFDKTCLVQIATRRSAYLIDPLALGGPAELAPLGPVLASPKVRVVFHAAEYDIYVLKRDCGFTFAGLFDTMISAQLLGYPSIGLAALVKHHFDVLLPKDEQRSDWSRRPLSDKQQTYAASDVQYLIRLSEKLEKELKKAGRLEWAEDDFAALTQREWPQREFDKLGYLRLKGARRLDSKELAVLRELYLARDRRAREIDRPPFKVLGNRTLLEIAELSPHNMRELGEIKGITELILRRMGRDIMAAVRKGRKDGHGPIPKLEANGRRRMDRRSERLLTRLKRWRAVQANELKMDPGVLCPNASLETIAWKNPRTGADLVGLRELKPWFVREFGDEVARALQDAEGEDEA